MTAASVTTRPPPWRDVRVLSWVFQLAIFAVVAAVGLWLFGNYSDNVARSGIPTNFDFLDNPASFEIPGNDFSQRQPVLDVIVEGVLNTLRVSAVGIVLATVLGTLVGIGRLSSNWVVNRLATVYVEVVRNVPLLILLTFTFLGVVLQVLPTIQEAWNPGGIAVLSNRGIGVPWYQGGSGSQLFGLVAVGAIGWWLIARWRRRVFERTGTPSRAGVIGGGFLVVVLVVGWIVLGFGVTVPEVDGRRLSGGMRIDPSYFALLVALVVYTASHIAEIVRGSIQAVPRGQDEAAQALALNGFQRLWKVVLPQAMRIAIPPLGNQYLNLIKNSSLGAGFAYFELTNVTRVTVGNGSPAVPAFALALGIYVLLSLLASVVVNIANRRFKLVER
ncbi:MAG: ABC transporter permease subunit [Acidimicrobiia bacterium]|nr:ABC transporter permease subunit [Acidimicrobiia bacterium]